MAKFTVKSAKALEGDTPGKSKGNENLMDSQPEAAGGTGSVGSEPMSTNAPVSKPKKLGGLAASRFNPAGKARDTGSEVPTGDFSSGATGKRKRTDEIHWESEAEGEWVPEVGEPMDTDDIDLTLGTVQTSGAAPEPGKGDCSRCHGAHKLKECPERKEARRARKKAKREARRLDRSLATAMGTAGISTPVPTTGTKRTRGEKSDEGQPRPKKPRRSVEESPKPPKRGAPRHSRAAEGDVKVKATKRALQPEHGNANPYADGNTLMLAGPDKWAEKPPKEALVVRAVAAALKGAPVQRIHRQSRNFYAVRFARPEEAMRWQGAEVTLPRKDFGLRKDVAVKLSPYLKGGPRMFVCSSAGPVDRELVAGMVAAHFGGKVKFYCAKAVISGIETSEMVLAFEKEPGTRRIMVTERGTKYNVDFRAGKQDECRICPQGESMHRQLKCGYLKAVGSLPAAYKGYENCLLAKPPEDLL